MARRGEYRPRYFTTKRTTSILSIINLDPVAIWIFKIYLLYAIWSCVYFTDIAYEVTVFDAFFFQKAKIGLKMLDRKCQMTLLIVLNKLIFFLYDVEFSIVTDRNKDMTPLTRRKG